MPTGAPSPELSWQCSYSSDWRVFAARLPVEEAPGEPASAEPIAGSPAVGAVSTPAPSLDQTHLQPTRMWLAIDPATEAAGPLDPRIPFVRIVLEEAPALGYCAPASGPDRPPSGVVVTVWSLEDGGGALAMPIRTVETLDAEGDSSQGLFVPDRRADGAEKGWPAGRYVFVVLDGSGTYQRWFGVELIHWAGGGPAASPGAVATPGTP